MVDRWIIYAAAGVAALALGGYVTQQICEARDAKRYPPPGRMIDVGGRRLHILCKGDGPGPSVVIEQGLFGPSILWWPVQDSIAKFTRVCTYDRAGFLWSDPAAAAGIFESVADLHTLLTTAEIPPPYVLVGHSFGGPLVRLYAREHPDEVAGLVLVDSPGDNVLAAESFPGYARTLRRMMRFAHAAACIGIVRLVMAFQGSTEGIDRAAARALRAMTARSSFYRGALVDMNGLEEMRAEVRLPPGLGTLDALPLGVITHGIAFQGPAAVLENGWAEGQKDLASLSTGSELIVATKSNHMINTDEPELVVDVIRRVHTAARDRARASDLPP